MRIKISSEPPTKAPACGEFRRSRLIFQARLKFSSCDSKCHARLFFSRLGPLGLQLHSQTMKHARLVRTIFAQDSAKTFPNRDSDQNCSLQRSQLNDCTIMSLEMRLENRQQLKFRSAQVRGKRTVNKTLEVCTRGLLAGADISCDK